MSAEQELVQTYTIKEASEQCGLPESTLRYYESIGIIDAVARDDSSKHRVYSEDDINLLDAIACLNATGLSIDDMRTYLQNRTHGADAAQEQIALLQAQYDRIQSEAKFLSLREEYVRTKISYWRAIDDGDEALAKRVGAHAKTIARDLKFPNN